MVWARGHRSDWDYFAAEAGDAEWSYDHVLQIYRRIENWRVHRIAVIAASPGRLGPARLGSQPIAHAMLDAAREVGIPTFAHPNGQMMEGPGARLDFGHAGSRRPAQSLYRAYGPSLARPPQPDGPHRHDRAARPDRAAARGRRRSGPRRAGLEIRARARWCCPGRHPDAQGSDAFGIGDHAELTRFASRWCSTCRASARTFRTMSRSDALGVCRTHRPRNSGSEATCIGRAAPGSMRRTCSSARSNFPCRAIRTAARGVPAQGWTMFAGLARPASRGRLRLTSAAPGVPLAIEANMMADPADLTTAVACVDLCRALGNAQAFRPHVRGEAMPGDIRGDALEDFIRDAAVTYWHQSCTARWPPMPCRWSMHR